MSEPYPIRVSMLQPLINRVQVSKPYPIRVSVILLREIYTIQP